jgi:undecaprenyl diphosphate synthase
MPHYILDTFPKDILPKHISIIMDGNRRWAKKKLLPTLIGYKKGAKTLKNILKYCRTLDIRFLTIYAFSSENWQRPKQEVAELMRLLKEYLRQDASELNEANIKVKIIGDRAAFDSEIQKGIDDIEALTATNKGMTLNIALNYGARNEIINAVQQILDDKNIIKIDEDIFAKYLYNSEMPDPDLLIRTGGDKRISNFLLWQLAYTELYFTETLWPAFNKKAFETAINDYIKRERRYGKI